jgi:hypothetical protein
MQLGKTRFHKSQAFTYRNEVAVFESKPGIGENSSLENDTIYDNNMLLSLCIGGEPLLGQKVTKNISVYPKGLGGDKPAWVAFDRQVNTQYTISTIIIICT